MPKTAGPGRKCCSACGQQVQKGDKAYLAVTCYHEACTPDEKDVFTGVPFGRNITLNFCTGCGERFDGEGVCLARGYVHEQCPKPVLRRSNAMAKRRRVHYAAGGVPGSPCETVDSESGPLDGGAPYGRIEDVPSALLEFLKAEIPQAVLPSGDLRLYVDISGRTRFVKEVQDLFNENPDLMKLRGDVYEGPVKILPGDLLHLMQQFYEFETERVNEQSQNAVYSEEIWHRKVWDPFTKHAEELPKEFRESFCASE